MTKFLHIADIHLGIKRYGLEERTKDFFRAWYDCLQKYAVREGVDFVLIAGDLFDRRQIDPQAANHAIFGLNRLKEAGIPVFAIEGNHDQRETGSDFSWLRSFSQWRFLNLLEPIHSESGIEYQPWNEQQREGSYIDYKDVRIFGSRWYGVTTTNVLPQLQVALQPHLRAGAYNIMMLHAEIEGQLNRPIPALSTSKLLQLREGINYLALGHIHKNFVIEDWAYNPGSLEAASMDEYQERRGAYLVELVNGEVRAKLVGDYYQRSFRFLNFDLATFSEPDEASLALGKFLLAELPDERVEEEPLVVVTLTGRLSFKSSLIKLESVKKEALMQRRVLDIIFRNETVPVEYAVAVDLGSGTPRSERELRVIEDLVAQHARYRDRAPELANLILEMKRLTLAGEPPDRLLELLERQAYPSQPELAGLIKLATLS
ncbi:MAG: exonuclease SbcCD subunit D [Acidobacteriota bacterium]